MTLLVQQLVLGLLIGALYGLAAAGLSLVFGVMRVLNVAHGELIMLGGYGAFWLATLLGVDPFASLLLVIPGALVLGAALYWGLFRFVVRAHEDARVKNSLLIGFGLALALHALAVRLWTADERSIPTSYAGAVLTLGGVSIPLVRLATLALALGTALAGAAGALVTVAYSVSPSIGLEWTLKALIVVVLAGLGSMVGTFVGGLVLGIAEAASAATFGGPYREIVGLLIFVVVLVVRPRGLFGR